MDAEFFEKLVGMGFGSAICCNLLEHVTDFPRLAAQVARIPRSGGWLFVSCPRAYPYHPDPLDNRFPGLLRCGVGRFVSRFRCRCLRRGGMRDSLGRLVPKQARGMGKTRATCASICQISRVAGHRQKSAMDQQALFCVMLPA